MKKKHIPIVIGSMAVVGIGIIALINKDKIADFLNRVTEGGGLGGGDGSNEQASGGGYPYGYNLPDTGQPYAYVPYQAGPTPADGRGAEEGTGAGGSAGTGGADGGNGGIVPYPGTPTEAGSGLAAALISGAGFYAGYKVIEAGGKKAKDIFSKKQTKEKVTDELRAEKIRDSAREEIKVSEEIDGRRLGTEKVKLRERVAVKSSKLKSVAKGAGLALGYAQVGASIAEEWRSYKPQNLREAVGVIGTGAVKWGADTVGFITGLLYRPKTEYSEERGMRSGWFASWIDVGQGVSNVYSEVKQGNVSGAFVQTMNLGGVGGYISQPQVINMAVASSYDGGSGSSSSGSSGSSSTKSSAAKSTISTATQQQSASDIRQLGEIIPNYQLNPYASAGSNQTIRQLGEIIPSYQLNPYASAGSNQMSTMNNPTASAQTSSQKTVASTPKSVAPASKSVASADSKSNATVKYISPSITGKKKK